VAFWKHTKSAVNLRAPDRESLFGCDARSACKATSDNLGLLAEESFGAIEPSTVEPCIMKYLAVLAALGSLTLTAPAKAQEVIVSEPVVTYYAPSVVTTPVTTYYAPSVVTTPVTTYYAPSVPVTSYYAPTYTSYYAPAVAYPAAYYYVSPRTARRWARWGYYW
jgi:hypothetical protein